MKRKIYSMVWLLLVWVCGMTSCSEESGLTGQESTNEGMLLEFMTRADEAQVEVGENRFNENTVTKADVFFFKADMSGTCIYAQVGQTVTDNKLNVKLDSKLTEGQDYYVYVIANANASFGYTNESALDMTLDDLKGITATTDWTRIQEVSNISLLMDGGDVLTVNKKVSGNIELTRAMAKVALFATAKKIELDGKQYEPDLGEMKVNMVYLVNSTNLKGDYKVKSNNYITKMSRTYQKETDKEAYYHIPFYSYPNLATTENRNDSYLELIIPWYVSGGGTSYQAENYYYRIPITGSDDIVELLRNHYYKVNVNVEVLGSLNPEEPVELDPDFLIMDWYSAEISADMQNYRYLVLNEYESYVYNNDELLMPYVSSSEIKQIDILEVTYNDYSTENTRVVTLTDAGDIAAAQFSVTVQDGKLLFIHPITNDDFVPYTIKVKVYNDQGLESDVWTIHQYPAIYIEGEYNENGNTNRFVNGYYRTGSYGQGDCFSDNSKNLGGLWNLDYKNVNLSNKNHNQYTIYVTSFKVDDKYTIGDPRDVETDYNFGSGADYRLSVQQYHGTKKNEVNDMISPVFKIASSWGAVNTASLTYNAAVTRCASYQENGYPAGRWRIPTQAEIRYIVSLSEQRKIPTLFGGNYWASSGNYYSTDENDFVSSNRDTKCVVRCVYDVWYWGDKKINEVSQKYDNEDFVWGDKGDEFYQ